MNHAAPWTVLLVTALLTLPAAAQEAGRVESVTGVVSVQGADGELRIMARGSKVHVGDTIDTQSAGFARIRLADGAELALRPNTSLRMENFRFSDAQPQEDSLAMRLLKGGLRTITGLIGKRKPGSFQLNGATATIGIRGTDFLARLCDTDCRKEQEQAGQRRLPPLSGFAGRVLQVQGSLRAAGVSRPAEGVALASGEIIYATDVLLTGAQDNAVVVFQDGTRASLQPNTRLAIERYRFNPAAASDNTAVFRLLQGGLRALTGLIGQRNPARFSVTTTVGTIGIRGTGFDAQCTGPCADPSGPGQSAPSTPPPAGGAPEGLSVNTWKGTIFVKNQAGVFTVNEGESANTTSSTLPAQPLQSLPQFFQDPPAPRPDTVPVDMQRLFPNQQDTAEPGMYVHVFEGAVDFNTPMGAQLLNRGETGFLGPEGTRLERLSIPPSFIRNDQFIRYPQSDGFACGMK